MKHHIKILLFLIPRGNLKLRTQWGKACRFQAGQTLCVQQSALTEIPDNQAFWEKISAGLVKIWGWMAVW
jgi:hypothetical protein